MENSTKQFKVVFKKPTWKKPKTRYFEDKKAFKAFLSTIERNGYTISLYSLVGDGYKFVSNYW